MNHAEKVYLIDDDEINNFICANILRRTNFSTDVVAFDSGTDALAKLNQVAEEGDRDAFPDVIFLDINMPIMNGWDFLLEYRKLSHKIDKKVSLFLLSSSIYQADVEKSKDYDEVLDFVTKPLNTELINGLIEKYFTPVE